MSGRDARLDPDRKGEFEPWKPPKMKPPANMPQLSNLGSPVLDPPPGSQTTGQLQWTPAGLAPRKVHAAMHAAMVQLGKAGITKAGTNVQQGYSFRGIDQVLAALNPVLSTHGLICTPVCTQHTITERISKAGAPLYFAVVTMRYAFTAVEDGSTLNVVMVGEAMDTADKATNKAMSAAYKYAMIQAFSIPVEGEPDADEQTHEPIAAAPEGYPAWRQTIVDARGVKALNAAWKSGADAMRAYFDATEPALRPQLRDAAKKFDAGADEPPF